MKKLLTNIPRVAVIGSGNMGGQITVELVLRGFTVYLYDICLEGKLLSKVAVQKMLDSKLITPSQAQLIIPRESGKDFAHLSEVGWILEVLPEDLELKKAIFEDIDDAFFANADSEVVLPFVTTNTSGILISELSKDRSLQFQQRFFGTHWFNPPRAVKLLEVIYGPATNGDLFEDFQSFAEERLERGVVESSDTQNFLANRFGVLCMQIPFAFRPEGMSVATVDAIFEILFGWKPLQTGDIVGLDLMEPVAGNVYRNVAEKEGTTDPDDPFVDFFAPIPLIQRLVALGYIGRKSVKKCGFYAQGLNKEKLMFDPVSGAYVPYALGEEPSLKLALDEKDPQAAIMCLLNGEDVAAEFARDCFFRIMAYAPFVTDLAADGESVELDRAMKLGFGWPKGPFEIMVESGITGVVEAIRGLDLPITMPNWVDDSLARDYQLSRSREETTRKRRNIVHLTDTAEVSLVEAEAHVFVVSFTNGKQLNALSEPSLRAIQWAIGAAVEGSRANFSAVVIANTNPKAFSAGADLGFVLNASREGNQQAISDLIDEFQKTRNMIRFSSVPVVAAIHGLTLGGGLEIALACDQILAHENVKCGFAEISVGLLPAGGGLAAMVLQFLASLPACVRNDPNFDPTVILKAAWRNPASGTIFSGAHVARENGILRPQDLIVAPTVEQGLEFLLQRAVVAARSLALAGYQPPAPQIFLLPGSDSLTFSAFQSTVERLGLPDEYSKEVALAIGGIICGGDHRKEQPISEFQLLQLEKEYFLHFAVREQSQQKMAAVVERKK